MNIWEIWFDQSVRFWLEMYYLPYRILGGGS